MLLFNGFNYSGASSLNLFYQAPPLYIMDNHKMALWCWYKHLQQPNLSLFHIDKHNDTLTTDEKAGFEAIWEEYHNKSIQLNPLLPITYPFYRWDNYLSIALNSYQFREVVFWTDGYGDKPKIPVTNNSDFTGKWIVNVDLDYFFRKGRMEKVIKTLEHIDVECLTIAISPECCGGWKKGLTRLENFLTLLGKTVEWKELEKGIYG